MRKAQIIGQVFIFILAAAIFILILTYGYRAVKNFMGSSEKIALIDFKTDLEAGIDAIKLSYGSERKLELRLPGKFKVVCIADTENPGDLQSKNPRMYSAWQTESENVFLVPKQETPIKIENINVPNGYFCTEVVNGKINLRIKGLGNKAEISEWT